MKTNIAGSPELGEFLAAVRAEVARAEAKFPTNEDQLAAFGEEAGELHRALLENKYGNAPEDEVYKEAVQAAAMAARVALHGDANFPYRDGDKELVRLREEATTPPRIHTGSS